MRSPAAPPELSLERLRALVEAYGADLTRMPEAERAAVQALLARSEAARKLVDEARALDQWLEPARADVPSPGLLRALETIPERHAQESTLRQLFPARVRLWTPLAAAAALLLGVLSGWGDSDTSEGAELAALEAESEELALSELSAVALGEELLSDLGSVEGESE